ncbi:MAG: hypothetical protein KC549_16950 [Myxococcales bacterium]|nr:hypothetical protein [Myxococcales bacterium]MCB9545643.1 hypothetical protein [Myxococcales bacterium]
MDHLTDQQFLELLRRLYALESPFWDAALAQVCALLQASSGLVGVQGGSLQIVATHGALQRRPFPQLDSPGFRVVDDVIVLRSRHRELAHDTVWVAFGVGLTLDANLRASSVASNLELAVDFALRRAQAAPLSERLREPDPERIDEVEGMLATLPRRSGDCLLLAARGMTNLQIAEYLELTSATVARCLQEAYRLFGVAGRNELDVAALLSQPKPVPPGRPSTAA